MAFRKFIFLNSTLYQKGGRCMAKKVQKETKKVQKKEVVKKEPEKITIEVQETVFSMFS